MIMSVLTVLVGAIHLYFMVLESFRWEHPRTRKVFGMTEELAAQTKAMAANQGLYNAFLGVGVIYALATGNTAMQVFLLLCVAIAGIIGAMTAVKAALYAQTIPAVLALAALALGI